MAPIRRYLRITRYSVLEVRVYLDNPHLAESWLLNPRRPILPRVIESVRPLVLPKLREENERRKKGGKKQVVKDTIVEDEFEVAVFLTETSTRHFQLKKQKHFKETSKNILQSNSRKLTGGTQENAMEIIDRDAPALHQEEGIKSPVFEDIPTLQDTENALFVDQNEISTRPKRPRAISNGADLEIDSDSSSEPLSKRIKEAGGAGVTDDKKKLAMHTTYDGFAIYGRTLCLVVKRKDRKGHDLSGGHAMMENWISSTQVPAPESDVS